MPRLPFTPGKDLVPIVQEAGRAPGPVQTGAEILAPAGIRSPDCPAHSQSLYRLSYPAHQVVLYSEVIYNTNGETVPENYKHQSRLHPEI